MELGFTTLVSPKCLDLINYSDSHILAPLSGPLIVGFETVLFDRYGYALLSCALNRQPRLSLILVTSAIIDAR